MICDVPPPPPTKKPMRATVKHRLIHPSTISILTYNYKKKLDTGKYVESWIPQLEDPVVPSYISKSLDVLGEKISLPFLVSSPSDPVNMFANADFMAKQLFDISFWYLKPWPATNVDLKPLKFYSENNNNKVGNFQS